MENNASGDVTRLLVQLREGDSHVLDELLPLIYNELRTLARQYLRRERPDHTLQPTALVHEAYLRLVSDREVRWQNRAQFFGVAANVMRRVLVDHARRSGADKRGGGAEKLPLDEGVLAAASAPEVKPAQLLALDEALGKLAGFDPDKARVVELRFFGGLSVEEAAEVLKVSPTTIKREWRVAKLWLHEQVRQRD
ncbi:MAG TPA: sigma-70 family RNA polymerase sigma factor [Pyrinomonadaceae bacterium]|nr:sigma-70 family RNA polymerase sigma factor [Pyrinomonadaceae bacterium]